MTGDPLYEPLGQDTAPHHRSEGPWRKLAMIAVAGFAVSVVGAVEFVDPDRPRATVVAVAPIEPLQPLAAVPSGPAPSPPSPIGPAPPVTDAAEAGAADIRIENGVKVIRLNPGHRADSDAGVPHGASGPGLRAVAPSPR